MVKKMTPEEKEAQSLFTAQTVNDIKSSLTDFKRDIKDELASIRKTLADGFPTTLQVQLMLAPIENKVNLMWTWLKWGSTVIGGYLLLEFVRFIQSLRPPGA